MYKVKFNIFLSKRIYWQPIIWADDFIKIIDCEEYKLTDRINEVIEQKTKECEEKWYDGVVTLKDVNKI